MTAEVQERVEAIAEGEQVMHVPQQRMENPAVVLPDAMRAIQDLNTAIAKGGAPARTLELVHMRASQINGCSACVDWGVRSAKAAGETDERLFAVAVWREMPYFTEAERAALALTEAATRLSDREEPVSDAIWENAVRHYDEAALSSVILMIAATNLFNRVNVTIRQAVEGQNRAAWDGN